MKDDPEIYFTLMKDAKKQTRYFIDKNINAWTVIKSMIKREPNNLGLSMWKFIECAMIGWQLRELAHRDMPQEGGQSLEQKVGRFLPKENATFVNVGRTPKGGSYAEFKAHSGYRTLNKLWLVRRIQARIKLELDTIEEEKALKELERIGT
jgi:hypothetical protein